MTAGEEIGQVAGRKGYGAVSSVHEFLRAPEGLHPTREVCHIPATGPSQLEHRFVSV